jgi:hypothetical protein
LKEGRKQARSKQANKERSKQARQQEGGIERKEEGRKEGRNVRDHTKPESRFI